VCATPLPNYKYPPKAAHGYTRAPLDADSFWNGVCKFDHEQKTMTVSEIEYAFECLRRWFPYLPQMSELATDEQVLYTIDQHKSKTSGYPWSHLGAPTKGQVLEKYGLQQVEDYYAGNTSMIGSTLKSEIRPEGKDARLFRPQDVSSYVEGIRLFHQQNAYLMETLHHSPLFNRYVIPGLDLSKVYLDLASFGGRFAAADGSSWDANFPLVVAAIIASFRANPTTFERVQRYYSMMYNGFTNCQGNVFHLVGQPSGHHNTSIDNSLGQCVMMALHACRSGLSIEQFFSMVQFRCCGDDLLYADRSGCFEPEMLSRTYESVGLYLEFEGDGSLTDDVYSLAFVGMRMGVRTRNGVAYFVPYLREQRTRASVEISKVTSTPKDLFAKFVSLAQLSFGDETLFAFCKSAAETHLRESVANNSLSLQDPAIRSLLYGLRDDVLFRRHLSWESVFTTQETVKLKLTPFKRKHGSSFNGDGYERSTRASIRETFGTNGSAGTRQKPATACKRRSLVLRPSCRHTSPQT